jgi:hypothetical protein
MKSKRCLEINRKRAMKVLNMADPNEKNERQSKPSGLSLFTLFMIMVAAGVMLPQVVHGWERQEAVGYAETSAGQLQLFVAALVVVGAGIVTEVLVRYRDKNKAAHRANLTKARITQKQDQ